MLNAFRRGGRSLALVLGLLSSAVATDYEVILNEIHYNPLGPGSNGDLEFVELHNLGSDTVDLGGWSFGEGIGYTCPPGLILGPKEYLVFSPEPARARAFYGLSRAAGPYTGRLDNNGEIISLLNASGRLVSRVHYEDDGVWPSLADGFGPSLEFTGADNGNDLHSRWAASLGIGGTPGARNSTYVPPTALPATGAADFVPATSNFKTFKGTVAPSNPALGWTEPGFNDGAWAELPGPFGFGNGHGFTITTQLGDMRNRYSTFYIRKSFELTGEDIALVLAGEKKLALHVTYDDAFVAYLNGVEVGRDNVGVAGSPAQFNAVAAGARAAEVEIQLAPFKSSLAAGANVIAIQGVNVQGGGGPGGFGADFFIGAAISFEEAAKPPTSGPQTHLARGVINEYRGGGAGAGFIELFNPRSTPLDLRDCYLRLGTGESFRLPVVTVLAAGSFRVFEAGSLGFDLPSGEGTCALLEPDNSTLMDALKLDPSGVGNSFGRYPDGGDDAFVLTTPTAGTANTYTFESPVVLNEIHFHPPFVQPGGGCSERCSDGHQWVELLNRGAVEADLSGWSLSKGVSFDFASGTKIPAGQTLVVAASLEIFKAEHPQVENVVGGWTGRLSHSSDTLNLRDSLGNRVDHVKYGDGAPRNDEAPDDGRDDGTFRGSPWPSGADGAGKSLELMSPALENKFGLSWRVSAAAGGTPGAPNSVFTETPAPVVDAVTSAPATPSSSEAVKVTCRISAPAGIQGATVEWARDGAAFAPATLHDDGAAPDLVSGDGVFSAEIPAQNDGAVVAFRIKVQDSQGGSILVPVPPAVAPYAGFAGPLFLYQVDDSGPPANGSPSYRIILTQRDLQQLRSRDVTSNVLLPCTLVSGDEIHHLSGIRFRGDSSRREANRSYRVAFPPESPFDGVEKLNLNGSNGGGLSSSMANDILGCDLFRRAGAPYPQLYPVNLRFTGEVSRTWDSRYGRKERIGDTFLERFFGGADGGNLYRARNPTQGGPGGQGSQGGNLAYLGTNPNSYRDLYEKKSNREEDDYSDLIELTRALDPAQTPNAIFADELEKLIDPAEWAQFFALNTILTNIDTGLWNSNGEDYFLYRVPEDSSRPDAGKFLILPWDLEETFTTSDDPLFEQSLAAVRRFITHPRFAQLYYKELAALRDGVFSRFEMRQRFGFVSRMFRPAEVFNVVDPIDSYLTDRIGYLDLNVTPKLVVGPVGSTVSGTTVIAVGEVWKYFRGRSDPPGGVGAWTRQDFDDSSWEDGATGIGYADGDDATELTDMLNNYTTVFTRKSFEVADPESVTSMTLSIDYDDAFVAYVNGNEVARSSNAPGGAGSPIAFNAAAEQTHEADGAESFSVSTAAAHLVAGSNVLAIVAINERASSTDLSLIPSLSLATSTQQLSVAGGCGGAIYATGSEILLSGTADPVVAQAVRVNGELATFAYQTGGQGPFGAIWSARMPLGAGDTTFRVTSHTDVQGLSPAAQSEDVLVRHLEGQFTQVGGTLAGDTTWTAAGSPYRITQTVQVPAGARLTIEPGVFVLGNSRVGINVQGQIVANGEEGNPVHFDAFSCGSPWGGITIQNTGIEDAAPVQTLAHCWIEHAAGLQGAAGVVNVVNSKILLDHCTLRSLSSNALDGTGADVLVRGSSFEEISEGVHCTSSLVVVEDSVFRHMIGDSDAIDFDATVRGRSRIARCRIEDSTDDGIDLATATVDILDNVIIGAADKAMSLESNGPEGGPTVSGNLIHGCGTGIALKNGVTVQGDHNTITQCQEGINLFAKDAGPEGGHGVFHSLIVWNNYADVLLDSRSTVEITYSDVGGGELWPGAGNISVPPLFASPLESDYSLLAGSPCIQTGRDGSDMGALPFGSMPSGVFLRFDANESGKVDISDSIVTLRFLFTDGTGPACLDRMDADDDGHVSITDAIYALRFLFQGGPGIPPPFPEAGVDPTTDELPCAH